MCLVEVENIPVLQIACYSRVQDGMKVTTDSEAVKKARQGMLEFLLSDHPLDCPVCDQSGECDLQNFYMEHGRYQSLFMENKIKRKKAFPIGPHVLLDQERCILCTRCVRFSDEVSKTSELGVINRGDRSCIDLFPGKTLDNPYSGNVIDICPVGALTEREFRFQCRVWYLSTQDSICTGCARGCNIRIHYNKDRAYKANGRRVMRIKPRFNRDVNQWWICDKGRFDYRFIDENRIEFPYARQDGQLRPSDWDSTIAAAARRIRSNIDEHGIDSVAVLVSPQLSNEELLATRQLFVEGLGITKTALSNPWEEPGPEDDILRRADQNPNTAGAKQVGFSGDCGTLLKEAAAGTVKLLYVFRHDLGDAEARDLLQKADTVIFQGVNWNGTAELADLVLAGATHAEKSGTFVNFEGRLQRFNQALAPLEDSLEDLDILKRLGAALNVQVSSGPDDLLKGWLGVDAEEIGTGGVPLTSIEAVRA